MPKPTPNSVYRFIELSTITMWIMMQNKTDKLKLKVIFWGDKMSHKSGKYLSAGLACKPAVKHTE